MKGLNFEIKFVFFGVFGEGREIKGIKAAGGVEREINVIAGDGVAESFIFVFGVDDDDFGAEHEGAENFQLDGIGFPGAGFGEDHRIGIFHTEAVKNNETAVVFVETI